MPPKGQPKAGVLETAALTGSSSGTTSVSIPQPAAESSSLPSGQSLSPSQSQRFGTQAYEPGQLNSPGAHVTAPERKK